MIFFAIIHAQFNGAINSALLLVFSVLVRSFHDPDK